MHLKAVIFDFDGTLTKQGSIDFNKIKSIIGCPENEFLLDYIDILNNSEQKKAMKTLEDFEYKASESSVEEEGAEEIIEYLNNKNIPIIIITRNSKRSVYRSLENFKRITIDNFYKIISRDDPFPVKPEPHSINHVAEILSISTENIIVIGDYIHDINSGISAGSKTIYKITNREKDHLIKSDFKIHSLRELIPIFSFYLPLDPGKLPNHLLKKLLSEIDQKDDQIIIGPEIGEDTAAIDIVKERMLIIKSDPITFTTDNIGTYAVNINMNDIATSGGKAKWMTVTLLLPIGIYFDDIQKIMNDINTCCKKANITICGGHTEITDSVNKPIVSCTLLGTVTNTSLINKKSVKPGDSIIVTKYAGIEGTAIIANDFYKTLTDSGFPADELDECKKLLSDISIINDAEIAIKTNAISALHDVTEGGIASALSELSIAVNNGFEINIDEIPILEITQKICDFFSIDPLGLIGSGSLIICCREKYTKSLLSEFQRSNIKATLLGKVNSSPAGKIKTLGMNKKIWPKFNSDELTKLYKK